MISKPLKVATVLVAVVGATVVVTFHPSRPLYMRHRALDVVAPDGVILRATLLTEVFDGPPGQGSYVLNPGDTGLLGQLDTIEASAASKRPISGKPTIAAHVDHLLVGLSVLNRWAAGEANPWAGVDWNASWRCTAVTDDEWRTLRAGPRNEAEKWRKGVADRASWDEMSASAALSTAAHTAYHFGAVRQILADLKSG